MVKFRVLIADYQGHIQHENEEVTQDDLVEWMVYFKANFDTLKSISITVLD